MLEEIITNFDIDKIRAFFFKKNGQFVRKYEEISNFDCCHFSNGIKIGEIEFTDKNQYFAAYAFKVDNDLTEYSGKKAQYDLAKKVLKSHQKDAGIFVFYDEHGSFRFSLVFPIYSGGRRVWNTFKRYTYFISRDQTNKTFLSQIGACAFDSLEDIKEAFSVEKVTKDFFSKYVLLFNKLVKDLDSIPAFRMQAEMHAIKTEDFAKKLLGQIVFLYFLQKKGWLGVPKQNGWGCGDRKFLRNIFEKCKQESGNFYNDYLEYLFYDTLNNSRVSQKDPDYSEKFKCKIPYLNGGLFEPEYDWKQTDMRVENPIFSEILDTFDQFNFTIDENTPSDVEVSVDPEMLGKIFENLLPENIRKGKGAFYTPREIVQYMCKESLISCLNAKLLGAAKETVIRDLVNFHLHLDDDDLDKINSLDDASEASENVSLLNKYSAKKIDDALSEITIVDPACGSGAFLVGILNEIIGIRQLLNNYYLGEKKSIYDLKKETILNCIYGVDIDPGAVDIAKLRLWLALVVDAKRPTPLPNLDFKIMQGNSLLEEYKGAKFYEDSNMNKLDLPDLKLDKIKKKLLLAKNSLFNADTEDKKKGAREEIIELTSVLVEDVLKKQRIQNKARMLIDLSGNEEIAEKSKKYIESTLKNVETDSLINNLANPKYPKPFFLWKLNFYEVFEKGGFDIVIGNPPWVSNDSIDIETKNEIIRIFSYSAKSRFDLSCPFIEVALEKITKKVGIVAYVLPEHLWIGEYFIPLRKSIYKKIQEVTSLKEGYFENVNNPASMVILTRADNSKVTVGKSKSDMSIERVTLSNNFISEETLLDSREKIVYPHKIYFNLGYIKIREKIIKQKNILLLGQICIVTDGVQTANILNTIMTNSTPTNKNKYFKALRRGASIPGSYGYARWDGWWILKPEYADTYKRPGYSYNSPKRQYCFESDQKIILRQTEPSIVATIDNEKYRFPNSIFQIVQKVSFMKKVSLFYLLGLINSKFIRKYYSMSAQVEGTTKPQIYINILKSIPIKLSESYMSSIEKNVDQILTLKKQNKDADTKNLESQIDQLVYKLYDLTTEEIEIVEN